MKPPKKIQQLYEVCESKTEQETVTSLYHQYLKNSNHDLVTVDFVSFQTGFLDQVYNYLATTRFQPTHDVEDHLAEKISTLDLNVNVDSANKEGLVRSNNKLHLCRKCHTQGRSDSEARNISSTYTLPRGDEIGIEKLTCNTCGSKWAN